MPSELTSEISARAKVGLIRSPECFQKAPTSEKIPLPRNGEDEVILEDTLPQSLEGECGSLLYVGRFHRVDMILIHVLVLRRSIFEVTVPSSGQRDVA